MEDKNQKTSTNLSELPEGCLSHILSLTSPKDVFRSSAVSKQFLSASNSDTVWEKFLPSDYHDVISNSSSPLEFRTKKDLFLLLCRSHILIDAGTKSFALDKWSGKKCYMLAARTLAIAWGDTPQYWRWKSIPESRFSEIAELRQVCWFDVKGKIHTKLLTPNTTYGAYFVFKLKDDSYGFKDGPLEVYISKVDDIQDMMLPTENDNHGILTLRILYLIRDRIDRIRQGDLPTERDDGWMEIEIGRYEVGEAQNNIVLEMSVRQVKIMNWKSGLVVHGIELRPLS